MKGKKGQTWRSSSPRSVGWYSWHRELSQEPQRPGFPMKLQKKITSVGCKPEPILEAIRSIFLKINKTTKLWINSWFSNLSGENLEKLLLVGISPARLL